MEPRFLSEPQIRDRIREHTSARYARLDQLDRYVEGKQYEGRPSWFNDEVPLFDRAPCVTEPAVKNAIRSHIGLIFKKQPVVTSAPDEDETALDPDYGLDEAASATVDAGIVQIFKHARLLPVCKKLLRDAMAMGSAVSIATVRNGRLAVEVVDAKCCTPTWSKTSPGAVERLEIKYPYERDIQDPATGRWGKTVSLFRRVIDARRDVTYLPVDAPAKRADPVVWQEDPALIFEHGFGFCPVVWYKYMGTLAPTHEHDGQAIHGTLLSELTALDFALSQRHRATLYTADPIILEIGVMPGSIPTEPAQQGAMYAPPLPGFPDDAKENAAWRSMGTTARKRSPGRAWQYQNPDARVSFLTLPAGALEACQMNADKLARTVMEALHWAPIDPKEMQSGATLSGRALELLYTKQVTYCEDVRGDFADGLLLPLLGAMFRVIVAMHKSGARLALPGYEKLAKLLAGFETKDEDGAAQWVTPRMSVKWGDYFAPAETEQKALAETMVLLVEKGLLKRETAVAAIAQVIPSLDIQNPTQYTADIEADNKRKAEEQMALMQKAASAQPGAAPPPAAAPAQKPPAAPQKPPAKVAPPQPRQPKPTPFKRPPRPQAEA